MPLMDGGEVLTRIGHDEDITIIVISGQPEPPAGTLGSRVQFWLVKPVSIDDLVEHIQRLGRPQKGRAAE